MAESSQVPAHEARDINARGVFWFAVWLVIATGVIFVVVAWIEFTWRRSGGVWPHHSLIEQPSHEAPSPALQISSSLDLDEFRAAEDRVWRSHGWMDRSAKVIRIPVPRAMDLLLERGLPSTGTTMPMPGPAQESKPSEKGGAR